MEPKNITTKFDDLATKGKAVVAKVGEKIAEIPGKLGKLGTEVQQKAADMVSEGGHEPQEIAKKAAELAKPSSPPAPPPSEPPAKV